MASLEVMQEEPWRQEKLRENFTYMRTELKRLGFELGKTETAVIPIYIRDDLKTVMMWKSLLDDYAIYVNPFITPGVAAQAAGAAHELHGDARAGPPRPRAGRVREGGQEVRRHLLTARRSRRGAPVSRRGVREPRAAVCRSRAEARSARRRVPVLREEVREARAEVHR